MCISAIYGGDVPSVSCSFQGSRSILEALESDDASKGFLTSPLTGQLPLEKDQSD